MREKKLYEKTELEIQMKQFLVYINFVANMGLNTTKPVLEVSDKASFKPASSATVSEKD